MTLPGCAGNWPPYWNGNSATSQPSAPTNSSTAATRNSGPWARSGSNLLFEPFIPMAQTATIYNLSIDLADIDRGVYETLDLRVAEIPVYAFDRSFVDEIAGLLGRRSSFSLSITERELYLEIAGRPFRTTVVEHRIPRQLPG